MKSPPAPGSDEAKRRSDTGVPSPLQPIPAEMPEGSERGEGCNPFLLIALGEQLLNRLPIFQHWTIVKIGIAVLGKGPLAANI